MKSLCFITGYVFLKSVRVLLWFAVFIGFLGQHNSVLGNKFTSEIGTGSQDGAEELMQKN